MVRKPTSPTPTSAHLSSLEMQAAISRIDRRLNELKSFDVNSISSRKSPELDAIETKIHALISYIYPSGTVEFSKYISLSRISRGSINMMHETPIHEIRDAVNESISSIISKLESMKALFEDELEDAGLSAVARPLRAYEGLDLHPAIERACGDLFRNGHYANAIEDSVKALNALVRLNSGIEDKDGVSLMQHVFSSKAPVLKFNSLTDKSDEEEQLGFMMMFSGAVSGLRNPRAHKLIKDDAERTLEFIAFISLLAKLADASKR